MWSYDDSRAAVRDALRLSRAMTFKAAVADLALGGGKGVIMAPADGRLSSERRHRALLDFGDAVESLGGRYITDLESRHGRDRGAQSACCRTGAQPRWVRRPEPVDRTRCARGD